jgi:hypothetical protein
MTVGASFSIAHDQPAAHVGNMELPQSAIVTEIPNRRGSTPSPGDRPSVDANAVTIAKGNSARRTLFLPKVCSRLSVRYPI